MAELIKGVRQRLAGRAAAPATTATLPTGDQRDAVAPLPPGGRDDLDALERHDRAALVRRAQQLGPIFTGVAHGELYVVVVGLSRGRRLLLEHADALLPVTLDIESMVPKGMFRQMRGADHLEYRRQLVRAAKAADPAREIAVIERVCRHHLDAHVRAGDDGAQALLATASATATSLMVALVFGVEPDAPEARRIVHGYHVLGPYGMAWTMGPRQHEGFALVRDELRSLLEDRRGGGTAMSDCILASIADDNGGDVDDTMLGNLVFMVEMARADVKNQLRWLARYAASHPELLDRITAEVSSATTAGTSGERSLTEAFALEQLRADQSERMTRLAERDIVFDGFLIPAGAHVRLCLWEPHQDPSTFPHPERFDPDRFTGPLPSNDSFSPFGLDHHQCPFGGTAIRVASTFVGELATTYRPSLVADGPIVRGAYHWEPSRRLAVRFDAAARDDGTGTTTTSNNNSSNNSSNNNTSNRNMSNSNEDHR